MHHGDLGFRRRQLALHERLDVRHPGRAEVLQQPLVALFQNRQLAENVLQALLDVLRVFLGVDRQRLGQVVGQADVIDDEPALLALRHAVHPRDGLEQVVLLQLLVDVHDLLDRRIEAGQQHVADDQEGDAGERLLRIVEVERLAEVLHGVPALALPSAPR